MSADASRGWAQVPCTCFASQELPDSRIFPESGAPSEVAETSPPISSTCKSTDSKVCVCVCYVLKYIRSTEVV